MAYVKGNLQYDVLCKPLFILGGKGRYQSPATDLRGQDWERKSSSPINA